MDLRSGSFLRRRRRRRRMGKHCYSPADAPGRNSAAAAVFSSSSSSSRRRAGREEEAVAARATLVAPIERETPRNGIAPSNERKKQRHVAAPLERVGFLVSRTRALLSDYCAASATRAPAITRGAPKRRRRQSRRLLAFFRRRNREEMLPGFPLGTRFHRSKTSRRFRETCLTKARHATLARGNSSAFNFGRHSFYTFPALTVSIRLK